MKKYFIVILICGTMSLAFEYYGQKSHEAQKKDQTRHDNDDGSAGGDSGVVGSVGSASGFQYYKGTKEEVVGKQKAAAGPSLGTPTNPDEFKKQAYMKIDMAREFANDAQNMVKQNPNSKESITGAIAILAEAGKLFEQSGRMIRVLGPQYANQKDAEGCDAAVQGCLSSINMCRERIKALILQEQKKQGAGQSQQAPAQKWF